MRRHIAITVALLLSAGTAQAQSTTEAVLDSVQHRAFEFFWDEVNPANGLVRDRSQSGSPCSIAAVGFGLTALTIGIEHGWITRDQGRDRVLTTLQTFWNSPQGPDSSGFIGYKGLYYHFLDMTTGLRTWNSELSTIDTALLFAGILHARQYFTGADPGEVQIRQLADSITYRADWNYMRNSGAPIKMGWKPRTGFSGFGDWKGYNEAMIMYIIALGSPTHAIPAAGWTSWTSTYSYQTLFGQTYVVFPPLFGHQYSHCWIDYRYIWDTYMQTRGLTYFENSRRATLAQRAYCIANPLHETGYSDSTWGLTACDGSVASGGYNARGAPPAQNDDGTIAPTAATSSIAFAPEVSIPAIRNMYFTYHANLWGKYGFRDAFHLGQNWWDPDFLGIDQGPIVIMIENYLNGSVWVRTMLNPTIQLGLQRAGFTRTTTAVDPGGIAASVPLLENRPNPFRHETEIEFSLASRGPVRLALYDVSGREVARLVDGVREAGLHHVTLDARGLRSGVYFYRLVQDSRSDVRRCVVLD